MNIEAATDSPALETQICHWRLACTALKLLQQDPQGMRGLLVSCSYGPVYQAFMKQVNSHFQTAAVPASVSTERLNGGLDINETLIHGTPVYKPGLLQTEKTALVVNGAERLPTTISSMLASFLDKPSGHRLPVLIVFDESTDEEPHLADTGLGERLGLMITLPHLPLAVLQSEADQDICNFATPINTHDSSNSVTTDSSILEIGQSVGQVLLPDDILRELTMLAAQLGVDSLRALYFALRVAKAHALLRGRQTVEQDDAVIAVQLVLAPRATSTPTDTESQEDQEESPPDGNDSDSDESLENPPVTDKQNEHSDDDQSPDDEQGELSETLLEAAQAALPMHLIAQLARGQTNHSGSGRDSKVSGKGRTGRPTGVKRPRGGLRDQRLNLIETLKSAVPKQKLRRQGTQSKARIQVRPEDFRVTRFKQPSRTTTIFVVDASGSAALHRLAEAKGAVELLLAECYVRRDRVAMISFRGQQARLELPPTRSLVRAKRELAGLPGGGGTPLASGIDLASSLVHQLKQAGETPVVIFMSDGKANIDRHGQASRKDAMDDAHAAARQLAATNTRCLFIDTSPRASRQAAHIAESLQARYLPLPQGSARKLPSLLAAS
ncbi:MAG: VWA domain-containing protein [Granulosicoccus sp.]